MMKKNIILLNLINLYLNLLNINLNLNLKIKNI